MSTKRFLDHYNDGDDDFDQPKQKRTMGNRPTFASVIREAVTMKFFDNFCTALEPMLRKVVNEEVENGIKRCRPITITRSPSLRIQAPEPTSLQLIFTKKLHLPIFTGTKILDNDNGPLQLFLVDINCGGKVPVTLPYPIKIEIVVLDGDFDTERKWKDVEFNKNVVKERTGRRPLLTGDLNVVMRDGYACLGDIEFTDNSSWIRSRKFRVGARVATPQKGDGPEIRGAMTESFVVRDHRGELYKKHDKPALQDEVWRLEKIGKGGAFDRKLSNAAINTVQDFLKLSVVDQPKLRKILGSGMSDKMWKVTISHARKCVLGEKLYVLHGNGYNLTLNPICEVVKAEINGHTYPSEQMNTNKGYIENLVRHAYANWNCLEEIGGLVNETALLTQGDLVDQQTNQQQHLQEMMRTWPNHQQPALLTDGSFEVNSLSLNNCNNEQRGQGEYDGDWIINAGYIYSPNDTRFQISESSSEGDFR